MDVTFDGSVSTQQEQWFKDALARSLFDFETKLDGTVVVKVVPEPSCPGHKDYMCTQTVGLDSVIEIRQGADDPSRRFNGGLPDPAHDIKAFFQESSVHELCHVVTFEAVTTDEVRSQVAALFVRDGATGEGEQTGTLADWNPLDKPWEDRIQEAVAEVLKDAFLPEAARVYDNRTNWELKSGSWDALLDLVGLGLRGPAGAETMTHEGVVYKKYPMPANGQTPNADFPDWGQTNGWAWSASTGGWPRLRSGGGIKRYDINVYFDKKQALEDGRFLVTMDFSAVPGWMNGTVSTPQENGFTQNGASVPIIVASTDSGEDYAAIDNPNPVTYGEHGGSIPNPGFTRFAPDTVTSPYVVATVDLNPVDLAADPSTPAGQIFMAFDFDRGDSAFGGDTFHYDTSLDFLVKIDFWFAAGDTPDEPGNSVSASASTGPMGVMRGARARR